MSYSADIACYVVKRYTAVIHFGGFDCKQTLAERRGKGVYNRYISFGKLLP